MSERNLYHYPKMTDITVMITQAVSASKTDQVIVHYHPYDDNGCSVDRDEALYMGLPRHERYANGKKETVVPITILGDVVGYGVPRKESDGLYLDVKINDNAFNYAIKSLSQVYEMSIKDDNNAE